MVDAYDRLKERLTAADHELFWMLSTPELRVWAIEQANKFSRPTEGIFAVARAMVYEVTRKPEPITPPAIEDDGDDGFPLTPEDAHSPEDVEAAETWREKRGLGDGGR